MMFTKSVKITRVKFYHHWNTGDPDISASFAVVALQFSVPVFSIIVTLHFRISYHLIMAVKSAFDFSHIHVYDFVIQWVSEFYIFSYLKSLFIVTSREYTALASKSWLPNSDLELCLPMVFGTSPVEFKMWLKSSRAEILKIFASWIKILTEFFLKGMQIFEYYFIRYFEGSNSELHSRCWQNTFKRKITHFKWIVNMCR